jgi:hypothetical protein
MGAVVKLKQTTQPVKPAIPYRRPNAELRTREHLTVAEVESLIEAAKSNRHGHRDATMILVVAVLKSICSHRRSTSSSLTRRPCL